MQRIQSITLKNFKFFYGTETDFPHNKLVLNQNNLLLYGENGSGKSSIYWAFYTFLQSCLKDDENIIKYFDPNDSQNLRNRFAEDNAVSAIVLEIINEAGTITKEISNNKLETNKKNDTTINKIIAGSDFINYKYLSKLYDFRNSEEINLFDLFEREILMFIDFKVSYTDNKGNLSKSTLASDWWKFICEAPKTLSPNKKNKNTANRSSEEYLRYVNTTIPKFVELLKSFLGKITTKTNKYLKDDFKEDFQIKFETDLITCNYNNWIDKNAEVSKPDIRLTVLFDHDKLSENKKSILRPHTFLNEARLTAIALAMRLAMLDERLYDVNSASLLVLDDLLLSLDMSHRDRVLEIILKKVDEYQILILTHDRAFYNLCKRRIDNLLKKDDTYKWEFKEMYQDCTDDNDKIPIPFVTDYESYFSLAKTYFKKFDYQACVNYLRKETERLLRELLPYNKTVAQSSEPEGSVPLLLNKLINNFEDYYKTIGGNFEPFEKLVEYKDLLMNPLSHHNFEAPIYKQEIVNTFEILKNLNQIKILSFETDPNNENQFLLTETDSNGEEFEYSFYLKEQLLIRKDLDGKIVVLTNPKCWFETKRNLTTNSEFEPVYNGGGVEFKFNEGYDKIMHRLGTKGKQQPKELVNIVSKDGQKLIDKLNA